MVAHATGLAKIRTLSLSTAASRSLTHCSEYVRPVSPKFGHFLSQPQLPDHSPIVPNSCDTCRQNSDTFSLNRSFPITHPFFCLLSTPVAEIWTLSLSTAASRSLTHCSEFVRHLSLKFGHFLSQPQLPDHSPLF